MKRAPTNVRVGPGTKYPIRWIYRRRALPVEVMAEFGNWRQVRGSDGSDGWVHSALLSANRTALVSPWNTDSIDLKSEPTKEASVIARLKPRVLVDLYWCDRTWCSVGVRGRELYGYARQIRLWGVYPDEIIASRSIENAFWGLLGG
ncbi:SH3 domain-containing protein [Microvirga sp. GCM10011540]|uniref:SH3 domain-containing protein n=1 Tax=Microvirga sp. GCM10011540 TaxID=3317338 RepID=UPI00360B22EC